MKFLTTTICTIGVLLAFGQSSFLHIESQHLQNLSTEYFGSLANEPKNDKVDKATLINFNSAIKFNGTDDYLKVTETIPDANQMTIFSVFSTKKNLC